MVLVLLEGNEINKGEDLEQRKNPKTEWRGPKYRMVVVIRDRRKPARIHDHRGQRRRDLK